ncbi:Sodium:proton antiporter [Methylocella tundrae]|uniref:Sodium:proton antiporter n=1 Tax=Methylocella tundrae TaxID=227605 RepID=A0A4U8YWN7_METTU|nr:Na+/H+ antiporter subunit E [Methylocella tundrae]VFU07687.1 Sodium:proton antiporter [Methylocella tundrae]
MSALRAEAGVRRAGAATARGPIFFAFWLMISGRDLANLPVGAAAAAAATWTSLRLLPPGESRLRPLALAALILRFARQSVVSGVEVAWRALDPRLPLRPGFVAYPLRLPRGGARSAFCAFSSLLPGTLPTGIDDAGVLLVHCLDVEQPVAANLAAEESLFMRALGHE